MSFRKASAPVMATNPNAETRQRLDQFSSIAHAHTSLAAPIKAYRINNCGSIKKSRVNEDPENEIYTAVKLRDESMGQNS